MTVVCGDSHTSTHGAFAALAFGIGTSEVEHVLATQCLLTKKSKSMLIRVDGRLAPGVTSKDLVLAIIGRIGTAGGSGHAIEFAGEAVRALSMEARMTMCNMAIEAGARAGMIAADERTFDYIKGRAFAPTGEHVGSRGRAMARRCAATTARRFDTTHVFDAATIRPQVTWGTSPEMVVSIEDRVPDPDRERDATRRDGMERALSYMGLAAEHADDRDPHRQGVHRLVHQFAHRGPAAGRGRRARAPRRQERQARDGRARVGPREGAGGSRGPRPHLPRRGLRMARARMLDVPRDERRQARAGRALRVDVQPQFRRPPGRRRPHASRESGDGGRAPRSPGTSSTCGGCSSRHQLPCNPSASTPASSRRSTARTSTPTPSSRSSS